MRISTRQLSQHKQSFLSSNEPVRWEKEVYVTPLSVVQDEGRNITYFEAVPQSCKPLHSDIYQTQHCEQHQTLSLKEASLPQSMGGIWVSLQIAWGYPARSKPRPIPVTPFRAWLEAEDSPEAKFLECFISYRALSTWSQGLHLLFLIGLLLRELHLPPFQKAPGAPKHIRFTMMQN